MQEFPHHYRVAATADQEGDVQVMADGLQPIATAPPRQFDGPGDRWSPEDLLVGAIADCLVLTFRAIARHSKLDWHKLDCTVDGELDKSEGGIRFTAFHVHADLVIPEDEDAEKARRLIEKAESHCLVTASLSGKVSLEIEVSTK
ncbi:osmotically inducible protein OsmC [Microbulbifer flavimaris]|uniref:Osmotically inducible protein OsmC n=2 Tax=Microbulbiferaceae TaxID=1706373 RepID=A0ABX4HXQ2_9GAMM|nr:osmotically inducible protein OsmC [Microbulbifer sp. ZGT114]PCO04144.1 osmotically inducible protein OsmC [Microbulbifer flavimaris]